MSTTTEVESIPLKETCRICDRVRFGDYQYLGFGEWRHAHCYPGSSEWREYYGNLPADKRTDAGDILYWANEREL